MDRLDDNDNEQLFPSMGDNTTSTTRTKQINSQIQEVTIERTRTLTYGIEDNTVRAEEFLAYVTTLKLQHHIACIQKFIVGSLTMLEVTYQTPYNKDQLKEKIFEARITFNGQILKEYSNRDLKALQKIPVIKVMIFEAPFELDNFHIRQKLAFYGKLKDQEVYQHKFKGLDIHNGVRSINFLSLNKPLPTTIYVQGNRIRLKHTGQDRTPICAICKVKGQYRTECPQIQNHEDMEEQTGKEEEEQIGEEEKELKERLDQDPMDRTEEERREEEEKYPKSSWVTDENSLWSEESIPEKNGTCLSPTQIEETEWKEVKGKKKEKESKDSTKKKLRKKKKDTQTENRFEGLTISHSQESSDESVYKKKRRRETKEDDDNNISHEKHSYNKWENDTETDLDVDLTSTDEPYVSPDEEKKNYLGQDVTLLV